MIGKIELAGKARRYDSSSERHYHVRCLGCGRIDDVPGKPAEALVGKIQKGLRYEIVGHRLEFVGFCPRCRKKRRTGGKAAISHRNRR